MTTAALGCFQWQSSERCLHQQRAWRDC